MLVTFALVDCANTFEVEKALALKEVIGVILEEVEFAELIY